MLNLLYVIKEKLKLIKEVQLKKTNNSAMLRKTACSIRGTLILKSLLSKISFSDDVAF